MFSAAARNPAAAYARVALDTGARYADANGNEFWDKGNTATLTLSGTPLRACTRVENGLAD